MTIVVPVFNAVQDTKRLLEVLPQTLDPDTRVLLIDDGSDDPGIGSLLDRFTHAHPPAEVIRHAENLGFVAAVNSGIAAAEPGDHVILLNTDTLPPKGWVQRLVAPIATDANVASVTPLSNHAEILSVPFPGLETDPNAGMVAAIDAVARQFGSRDVTLPTGIGFCMALNRAFLNRIGGFDPAFGRGYGEEVDWCRRAIVAGGRHVAMTRLFVGHRGGASFGASEKAARIKASSRIISQRYPSYDTEVQRWIGEAPIAAERLALALAWLASVASAPVPVFLGHSLGGGAETALQAEVASLLDGDHRGAVIIRVGGPRAWRIELHGRGFHLAGDVATTPLLLHLMNALPNRRVVYSCGVGAVDPGAVPRMLLELAGTTRLEVRLHDFFPISPSWNLLDSRGEFAGIPAADTTDPAHQVKAGLGRSGVSHRDWRRLWGRVLSRADRIVAFAPSGRDLLAAAYPGADRKTVIRPHRLPDLPGRLAAGGQTIGVLGGINRAKGGAVLEHLAGRTSRRIVVIGEMDGQFRLGPPHVVHGRYDHGRITDLARRYEIGLWLIPSICPETFSFATHEALATGLPVLTFDLGAQEDAVRRAPNGHVLDMPPGDTAAIARRIEDLWPA